MKTLYGKSEPDFVDWPIGYDDLVDWYGKAEAELGVSADVEDQKYLGIYFSARLPRLSDAADSGIADRRRHQERAQGPDAGGHRNSWE